jgi:hypothetical protein
MRDGGIGRILIDHMLRISAGYNLGCDGVLGMAKKYESYGFIPAYRNVRYLGRAVAQARSAPELVPLSSVPLKDLTEYDAQMFPSAREKFLDLWTNQPDSFGLAHLENGRIKGYGVIRRCVAGHKVGPLFADNGTIAANILSALVSRFPGEEFCLDVPLPNKEAVDLALRSGMREVFSTLRMYTRGQPDIDIGRVFGITSFELG